MIPFHPKKNSYELGSINPIIKKKINKNKNK